MSFYVGKQVVSPAIPTTTLAKEQLHAAVRATPILPETRSNTPTGTLILDSKGRVVKHNRTMGHYIHRADGLEINAANCLLTVDEHNKKRKYVDQINHGSRDCRLNHVDDDGSAIRELEKVHIQNYQIRTYAITCNTDSYFSLAAVDRLEKIRTLCAKISKKYELTPAETDVFFHVIRGHNNKSIARLRNVSAQTIKSQMLSIFGKTGSACRGEMTWNVLLQAV